MSAADELALLPLAEVAHLIRQKAVSPLEVTRTCLERIEARDGELRAFITVTADRALDQARAAETDLLAGRVRGPLHGVPIALKDNVDTAGIRTTAGSNVYAERVPDADAEVVRRLAAAGAVFLGKLNMHEFAYGGSGYVSAFGAAKNPVNPDHLTGGSSSGSAAAVAAGMAYGALGSDTSGSIRVPAALCGIVGWKATYGAVSVRGVVPLAASYDHVGPMTRTVGDAALLHDVLAGYDEADIYAREGPPQPVAEGLPRVGVPRALFCENLDPEVAAAFEAALRRLAPLVSEVRDVTFPIDDDRTVFLAETWAFHRRYVERAPELYQAETLRRVKVGSSVAAAGYIEKWQELQRIRRGAAAAFGDCDLLVTPTVPVPAPSFVDIAATLDKLRPTEFVLLSNCRPFNITGAPALSVPCGKTRAGLPIGLQIVGRPFADRRVLAFGEAFERAQP